MYTLRAYSNTYVNSLITTAGEAPVYDVRTSTCWASDALREVSCIGIGRQYPTTPTLVETAMPFGVLITPTKLLIAHHILGNVTGTASGTSIEGQKAILQDADGNIYRIAIASVTGLTASGGRYIDLCIANLASAAPASIGVVSMPPSGWRRKFGDETGIPLLHVNQNWQGRVMATSLIFDGAAAQILPVQSSDPLQAPYWYEPVANDSGSPVFFVLGSGKLALAGIVSRQGGGVASAWEAIADIEAAVAADDEALTYADLTGLDDFASIDSFSIAYGLSTRTATWATTGATSVHLSVDGSSSSVAEDGSQVLTLPSEGWSDVELTATNASGDVSRLIRVSNTAGVEPMPAPNGVNSCDVLMRASKRGLLPASVTLTWRSDLGNVWAWPLTMTDIFAAGEKVIIDPNGSQLDVPTFAAEDANGPLYGLTFDEITTNTVITGMADYLGYPGKVKDVAIVNGMTGGTFLIAGTIAGTAGDGSVALTTTVDPINATSRQWQRKTGAGSYSNVVGATSATLTDNTVTNGTTYTYKLVFAGAESQSEDSNEITVTPEAVVANAGPITGLPLPLPLPI